MSLFNLFNNEYSDYLGVDIGTFSIKVVQLSRKGKYPKLVTYGYSNAIKKNKDELGKKKDILEKIEVFKKIAYKAGVTTTKVISALPSFSVFSSIINLTDVSEKDLDSAIRWEAKKVIPVDVSQMILDWKILKKSKVDKTTNENNTGIIKKSKKQNNLRILLTAAPKKLVQNYVDIFNNSGFSLISLETETFSLIRSLIGQDKSQIMIVEIGAVNTDITIVKDSLPILSRSIDVGGFTITKEISRIFNVSLERAEQFKYDFSLSLFGSSEQQTIPKIIKQTIEPILNEIKYTFKIYQTQDDRNVEKIILSGGSALIGNFVDYLSSALNKNVYIGNPWSSIIYPKELEPVLNEIGPKFSVAIGLALREMD